MLLLKGLRAHPPKWGTHRLVQSVSQSTRRWPRYSLVNPATWEYSPNELSWVGISDWHKNIYADTPERRIV
jgi:hypothetical protein